MSKPVRDDIDKLMEYNIYLPTRTLYMGSESYHDDDPDDESGVNYQMAERIIKGLHILDQTPDKPITIIMNNPGGDEYHGLAIIDAIKACQNHVTIKVFGMAMSMGSIILQAADTRIMAPNARVMIHYGTWGVSDHPKITYRWADEGKKFDKIMERMYLENIREKNPDFTLKNLQKMLDFDTILNAEETVELGLADSIGE